MAGLILCAGPVRAFELFGIRLWGEPAADEQIEIIDPLPYTLILRVSDGDDDLETRLQNASSLWRDRETPASGKAGLISKARGDYRRMLAALYSAGYYGPYISIRIAGQEAADMTLGATLPSEVPVLIEVQPGPEFRFGATDIVNRPPFQADGKDAVDDPSTVGFVTGAPALSGAIGGASSLAIEQWRQLAHAKARESDREILADHPTGQLDVRLTMEPGPEVRYGTVRALGSQRTYADFITFMADLPQGEPYDPDDVADAEDRLSGMGLFRSLRFVEGDVAADGSMPIDILVEDRRPRTVGAGGTYSTLDGLGLSAFWVHRNLFGRGERLRFDASVEGLLQTINPKDYDYNLGVSYTKPGVLSSPDTDAIASAIARRLDFNDYRETSITAQAGLSRRFSDELSGDLFVQASRGRYEDDFGTRDFTTYGLAGSAEYDRRNDEFDATRGYYLAVEAQPFYEAEYGNSVLRGTLEGRVYKGFGTDDRFVLAARARVGSYVGASAEDSPPGLLFFAGGGGSIRGYEFRSIGIETVAPDGETVTVGGRGLFLLSGELRTRLTERFGAVGFVDSGVVTADPNFGGSDDPRVGVGLGVRYFTGIGPLRVDVAVPVNPRPQDDSVALYIGIGQSF